MSPAKTKTTKRTTPHTVAAAMAPVLPFFAAEILEEEDEGLDKAAP